jgi:hypothetical protein
LAGTVTDPYDWDPEPQLEPELEPEGDAGFEPGYAQEAALAQKVDTPVPEPLPVADPSSVAELPVPAILRTILDNPRQRTYALGAAVAVVAIIGGMLAGNLFRTIDRPAGQPDRAVRVLRLPSPEPTVEAEVAARPANRGSRQQPRGVRNGQRGDNGGNCTSGYEPCIPRGSDVDCAGRGGNGPRFTRPGVVYRVRGDDPYGLDDDHDGRGCES